MARFSVSLLIPFALGLILGLIGSGYATPAVDPSLLNSGGPANIFVTMQEGTDGVLSSIASDDGSFANAGDRRTALYAALRLHAEKTQAPLLSLLATATRQGQAEVEFKSFWITNQIYVRGADAGLIDLLRGRDDIARVDPEGQVTVDELIDLKMAPAPRVVDYNLDIIRLPAVWANGVNGTGVVVANIDTGVRGTHLALAPSYKNDDYSWFDPVTGSKSPMDDHAHGTLTMGLLAGGLDVGVAFGAKWMACKGLNSQGVGDQSDLLACGQFILCPTHADGQQPDCSKAPAIVSNSWNSVDPNASWFLSVINAWRAAGILAVWSAGNYGDRGCSSLGSHAPYGNVFAVGSTNALDRLSYFSSQGPSPMDDKIIKPDISAPGETIRSAHNQGDNVYAQASGTSMAAPHVAGVLALVMGMDPSLGFLEAQRVLEASASTGVASGGAFCNGQPDTLFPNFQFGHGRLDAFAAYQCVLNGYTCLGGGETTTTTTEQTPTTIIIITTTATTTTTSNQIA